VLLFVLAPIWMPVLLPVWIIAGALFLWLALAIHLAVLLWWVPKGRRVIFVYSNSPNWQEYVEANILPRLPKTATVLNWSERSVWPFWSVAVWTFNLYGGSREFNPLGIVIRPFRTPKRFRFWRAFREYKHGKPGSLHAVEREFFDYIGPTEERLVPPAPGGTPQHGEHGHL
jgi:hypothetical protein